MQTLCLAPDLGEVHTARRFVADSCRAASLDSDVCDAAVLLTSEVVTNAFTHGRSEARITIDIDAGVVRIEVGDDNARPPRQVEDVPEALDGRGMGLVEALATHWGVRQASVGKVVWFEVAGGQDAGPVR